MKLWKQGKEQAPEGDSSFPGVPAAHPGQFPTTPVAPTPGAWPPAMPAGYGMPMPPAPDPSAGQWAVGPDGMPMMAPAEIPIEMRAGNKYCSFRGCSEETGISCAYVDRRERPCPTAWCPQHRYIAFGEVYCRTHGKLVDGTHTDFGEVAHVDLENRVPNLITWVATELEPEITPMMERFCEEYGEQLVVDPVRFVLVGVDRVRTWERSWKMCAHLGVSLRIAVCVEEANPEIVYGRVNSRPAVELPTPWHPDHGIGKMPSAEDNMGAIYHEFRAQLFMGVARKAQEWRTSEPPPQHAPAAQLPEVGGFASYYGPSVPGAPQPGYGYPPQSGR